MFAALGHLRHTLVQLDIFLSQKCSRAGEFVREPIVRVLARHVSEDSFMPLVIERIVDSDSRSFRSLVTPLF